MWFVVYVKPGCEMQVVRLLKATAKSDVLEEVFCPMAVGVHRDGNETVETLKPMFDGCVFVVAPSKWELRACMKRADGMDAICDRHPAFEVLEDGEAAFINKFAEPGERVVEASEATVDKSGWLTVQSGPLKKQEAQIVKRSGRRRWAYVESSIAGKPVNARLGLHITRND